MSDAIITIEALEKSFGDKPVLSGMSLQVTPGEIYAFLGRNGQGKTTTIRMLLGLLAPEGGQMSVLGLDPQTQTMAVRQRVGYLAEDQQMFGWMSVAETLKFMRPFYENWDAALADKLIKDFELPAKTKVKHLSKGQNVRLGLVLALAHRPQLVILDDPTLGLDPIMRKEFMRDVIEHLQGQGVTVFFSSHLLYEIEPVADRVAILDGGRIVRQESTETLRQDVRQFVMEAEELERLGELPGVLDAQVRGRQGSLVTQSAAAVRAVLAEAGIAAQEVELNLDEIFEAYVIGNRREAPAHA